jgi:hypothetical protein
MDWLPYVTPPDDAVGSLIALGFVFDFELPGNRAFFNIFIINKLILSLATESLTTVRFHFLLYLFHSFLECIEFN